MKKRLILLSFILGCVGYVNPLHAQTKMVVHSPSGSTEETALDQIKTLVFDTQGFKVNGWESQILHNYPFSDVRIITFNKSTTGIEETRNAQEALKVKLLGTGLTIEGWPAGQEADVAIYAVNGRCCYRQAQWQGESIDVSSMPVGVYILKVNQQTLKFVLR